MSAPGFWMNESGDLLRPAIETYLRGGTMTAMQIAVMRAYLRQWIMMSSWQGHGIENLRRRVQWLTSRSEIDAWLADAEACGIDPL